MLDEKLIGFTLAANQALADAAALYKNDR